MMMHTAAETSRRAQFEHTSRPARGTFGVARNEQAVLIARMPEGYMGTGTVLVLKCIPLCMLGQTCVMVLGARVGVGQLQIT